MPLQLKPIKEKHPCIGVFEHIILELPIPEATYIGILDGN